MYIAVMGYGTVGSGVVDLINQNQERIARNSMQMSMDIKYILDIRDFPDSPYRDLMIKDFNIILCDPEVKIVVETMGGVTFAYEFVKKLLLAGKSVVTSNKELVAKHGVELLQIADSHNVNFLFEASVGGGIPIIRPITHCLTANRICEVAGILNGTTNYILTQMIDNNTDFDTALKQAQQLGYAEANPSADVDGFDACRKICILAALCFGQHVYPEQVPTNGIRDLTLTDVECAKSLGCVIKLIADAKLRPDGRIDINVAPALIKNHSQLASVNDVFNAILVRGDALGDVLFYGRGAGKMPTASAVVADVIDAARHQLRKLYFGWEEAQPGFVAPADEQILSLFIRGKACSDAAREAIRQNDALTILPEDSLPADQIAFVTSPMARSEIESILDAIPDFEKLTTLKMTDY